MDPDQSRGGWRQAGISALALFAILTTGFFYLRSNGQGSVAALTPSIAHSAELSRDPATFAFISPTVGWAVVNAISPPDWPSGYFVFRTTDGGNHWQEQLEGQIGYQGFVPIAVHFISSQTGYLTIGHTAAGDEVYSTSDGGRSWRPMNLPTRLTFAVAIGYEGYVLALARPLGTERFYRLYQSLDGGITWRRLENPPEDAISVALRGPFEAWLGTADQRAPHVYSSQDGGQSWVRHDLPAPMDDLWPMGAYVTDVALLPTDGVMTTTTSSYTAYSQARRFTSYDSGQTWKYLLDPPGNMAYESGANWWAVKDGMLSKTDDGGQNWRLVTSQLPKWQFVPHVIDAQHAWAELLLDGGFGLALTHDGGLHWTRANVPTP